MRNQTPLRTGRRQGATTCSITLMTALLLGGALGSEARASDLLPGASEVLTDDDVIDSLSDLAALRNTIEHVPSFVIPEEHALLAQDPAMYEALQDFDLMMDFQVWRVELHPSFDLQMPSSNPVGHTVDSLTGDMHWLIPGLPSGDTLVMNNPGPSFIRPLPNGGREVIRSYEEPGEGGTYKVTRTVVYRPDGTVERRYGTARLIDASGRVDHTATRDQVVDENGKVIETRDRDDDQRPPETVVVPEPAEPDPERPTPPSSPPTPPPTPPPHPHTPPPPHVDAGICPLIIPRCAFLFREMQRAGHSYATGWIRVNPENWSDGPPGYRLDVDPGQLVVNPDPTVAEAKEGSELPPLILNIPVWINPPGPIDGLEAFEGFDPSS